VLNPVVGGDYRNKLGMPKWRQSSTGSPGGTSPGAWPSGASGSDVNAPIVIFLVSDTSRFRMAPDDVKLQWAAMDSGIVYQNIALFCAATGLSARPRALFAEDQVRSFMKLTDSQHSMLQIPVGYAAAVQP
jgi:nitroreductase